MTAMSRAMPEPVSNKRCQHRSHGGHAMGRRLLRTALLFGFAWFCVAPSFAQLPPAVVLEKPVPETTRDLLTIQQTAIEVAERVRESTVALQLGGAMGSGVIISEDGYILTAAHVVSRPGRDVVITFNNGDTARGKSLGMHTSADGALVKITDEGKWPHVPLIEKSDAPDVGDWCIALGHPGGFDIDRGPPVRIGRVIDIQPTVMRTDCPIVSGDSGGPLFDMQGRVIGIHSRITMSLTENYHVPAMAYREAWDKLVASELYPEPIPSRLLALLDQNKDGMLTREEQRTRYYRGVFDRLVEQFDLGDVDEISIREVTTKTFGWREATQESLIEIQDIRDHLGEELSQSKFARGSHVGRIFERKFDHAENVTVRIYSDGRRVALGTIVDGDGFILSKASRLKKGKIECLLPDRNRVPGNIVAIDDDTDLALIHIPANGLESADWSSAPLDPGTWVAVPQMNGRLSSVVQPEGSGPSRQLSIGIVGVGPRAIKRTPAMLGIAVDPRVINEAVVGRLLPKGGAAEAGMELGDVVVKVDEKLVTSVEDIREALSDFRAGDNVSVIVQRDGEEVDLNVALRSEEYILFNLDQFKMSGRLSRRRDGFESVFQMDAAVRPEHCGGPIIDANGQVVGITMARATRVASYGVGYEDIKPVLRRLRKRADVVMTGSSEKTEIE